METLHLILKEKWFDMILSGEKKEEYREFKEYWFKRFAGRSYGKIIFQHGYSKNSRRMVVECLGIELANSGNPKWGFEGECFVIRLGRILETKNCIKQQQTAN